MSFLRKVFINVNKNSGLTNLASYLLNRKCNIYSTNGSYNHIKQTVNSIDENLINLINLDEYKNKIITENGYVKACEPTAYNGKSVSGHNMYDLLVINPIVYNKGDDFDKSVYKKITRDNLVDEAIKNNVLVLYNSDQYIEFIKKYESFVYNPQICSNSFIRDFNEQTKKYIRKNSLKKK
jgi:hypothetical protein